MTSSVSELEETVLIESNVKAVKKVRIWQLSTWCRVFWLGLYEKRSYFYWSSMWFEVWQSGLVCKCFQLDETFMKYLKEWKSCCKKPSKLVNWVEDYAMMCCACRLTGQAWHDWWRKMGSTSHEAECTNKMTGFWFFLLKDKNKKKEKTFYIVMVSKSWSKWLGISENKLWKCAYSYKIISKTDLADTIFLFTLVKQRWNMNRHF